MGDQRDQRRRTGLRDERARASKQYRGGLFRNTHGVRDGLSAVTSTGERGSVFREWVFGKQQRRPPTELPVERPHAGWARAPSTPLRATWLGHSTVLLELDGRRVLTDPVFAPRIGPASFVGPRRFHAVPAELSELPPLDAVIVSHDHFDHLCAPTIRQLAARDVPIVTALGVGSSLEAYGVRPERITELDWHESVTVGGVRFTATPAQHFSGRALGGRNKTLWASWVIESDRRRVFFSGDTGLTPEFEDTGRRHGPFDLVMLEIGAFHPAWGGIHLGPENALRAFSMLGGGTLFPVHWGTFSLGFHAWDDPGEELLALAPAAGARIITPPVGRVFVPDEIEGPTAWWRGLASEPRRGRAFSAGVRSASSR